MKPGSSKKIGEIAHLLVRMPYIRELDLSLKKGEYQIRLWFRNDPNITGQLEFVVAIENWKLESPVFSPEFMAIDIHKSLMEKIVEKRFEGLIY